ncbi:basic proline-rich protein-like [Equus caballus]|uniref:basic proline-rich protein-like n=1 Tax=Equus caballus TaxID=9796 RepID=UPI0038B4150C
MESWYQKALKEREKERKMECKKMRVKSEGITDRPPPRQVDSSTWWGTHTASSPRSHRRNSPDGGTGGRARHAPGDRLARRRRPPTSTRRVTTPPQPGNHTSSRPPRRPAPARFCRPHAPGRSDPSRRPPRPTGRPAARRPPAPAPRRPPAFPSPLPSPAAAPLGPEFIRPESPAGGEGGGRAAALRPPPAEGSGRTAHLAPAAPPSLAASGAGSGPRRAARAASGWKPEERGRGRDAGSRLLSPPPPRLPRPGRAPSHTRPPPRSLAPARALPQPHSRTHALPHALTPGRSSLPHSPVVRARARLPAHTQRATPAEAAPRSPSPRRRAPPARVQRTRARRDPALQARPRGGRGAAAGGGRSEGLRQPGGPGRVDLTPASGPAFRARRPHSRPSRASRVAGRRWSARAGRENGSARALRGRAFPTRPQTVLPEKGKRLGGGRARFVPNSKPRDRSLPLCTLPALAFPRRAPFIHGLNPDASPPSLPGAGSCLRVHASAPPPGPPPAQPCGRPPPKVPSSRGLSPPLRDAKIWGQRSLISLRSLSV